MLRREAHEDLALAAECLRAAALHEDSLEAEVGWMLQAEQLFCLRSIAGAK